MTNVRLLTRNPFTFKYGRGDHIRHPPCSTRRCGTTTRFSVCRRDRTPLTTVRATVISRESIHNESQPGWMEKLTESIERNVYESNAMGFPPSPPATHEPSRKRSRDAMGCPVYVMLPLDTVAVIDRDGEESAQILKEKDLRKALDQFRRAGVHGVMVDIWWGIAEREGPRIYDFAAYRKLFGIIQEAGLKLQAVMSFHAAGSNVGDTCEIPLPKWVTDIGYTNRDIFYTDKQGHRNEEYLSLGCDDARIFHDRTPVEMYRDYVDAFSNEFQHLYGSVITEITVGLGPAGELRYPAYPEGDGRWSFPGVGEFQCYDKYMLSSLIDAAKKTGHEEWGYGGPHDAGCYNSKTWETGFFNCHTGTFDSQYGRFFLNWYSGKLIEHADKVLTAISQTLKKSGRPRVLDSKRIHSDSSVTYNFGSSVPMGVKLAGVHWWFKTRSHAAELTAGYYNTETRDGYAPIIEVAKKYDTLLSFTCVEMRDCEHPPESMCSPQALLKQVIAGARKARVPLAGENALQRYDEYAFSRITESAIGEKAMAGSLQQVTFLRMGGLMFDNWPAFSGFIDRMRTPFLE